MGRNRRHRRHVRAGRRARGVGVGMTQKRKAELVERLNALRGDREADHMEADAILCTALQELGLHDVVAAWARVPKWYA